MRWDGMRWGHMTSKGVAAVIWLLLLSSTRQQHYEGRLLLLLFLYLLLLLLLLLSFITLIVLTDNQPTNGTMKVYSLAVVLAPPNKSCTILSSASDLSSFSFYQRGSVGEFMAFFTKTIVERTSQGQRQSIQENSYTAHVYNRGGAEQLAGKQAHCYFVRTVPYHTRRFHIQSTFDLHTKCLGDLFADSHHRMQRSSLLIRNIPFDPHFPFWPRC